MIKKITNKDRITKEVEKHGYELGCYHNVIDDLSLNNIKIIFDNITEEYTDFYIRHKKQVCIISIATVDTEKDFSLYKAIEYYKQFGDEHLENALENNKITLKEYNDLIKQL